jgi:galactokinase
MKITEDGIRRIFLEMFGGGPREVRVTCAPGRVNLIGEHTDYNEGYVLPVPIDQHVWVAAGRRGDSTVSLWADDLRQWAEFQIDGTKYDVEHRWVNYVIGVADVLLRKGYALGGVDMVIKGDVPQGAGLSSSAAIEMASVRAFAGLFGLEIDPVEMAYVGKSAENEFVGVQCGIMDQFVSALGRPGHALLIDCHTNEYDHIPLDPGFKVVVVNTMVRRELASSAYNERRAQCEDGVRLLRTSLPHVRALRDVSIDDFERHQHCLPDIIRRRCRHVISENSRVLEAVEALRAKRFDRFGALMYESHESLRDDYGVSCPELDALVESARGIPGTVGARMTGAGFGGCTVNMVRTEDTRGFTKTIRDRYWKATGLEAEVYQV